jgi:hypothetical protein
MITLHTAEILIGIITFFIAYLIVITISNVFRAWAAYEMGDDTGVRLGYLTFNPLVHIDPIGLFFLFTFSFGWGAMVPIYPLNIRWPHRTLKLAIAYFSDTFMHFLLSIIGIVILLGIFDINILGVLMRYMIFTYNVSQLPIANMYPEISSWVVSIGFIFFAFVYLNVVLGVLNFIINFSTYLLFVLSDRFDNVARYAHYITIGLPILLILFCSQYLRFISVYFISHIGLVIAYLLGVTSLGAGL